MSTKSFSRYLTCILQSITVVLACVLTQTIRGDDRPNKPNNSVTHEQSYRHWSFQPIVRPQSPRIIDPSWVRNQIDAFILARLQTVGRQPSPQADRKRLIRRLHLDLTGLPPSLQALNDLAKDQRTDSYEQLVERLLASPQFGERWGQVWLDLARYADSDGYEMDYHRPNAWRWRDWVIQAINSDMPFDQFTIEQLAGDLLPNSSWHQKLATGFHRNTLTNTENGIDKEEFRSKAIVDRVNTTATVWLGLTIECAECHSHKYDPFLHEDYYRLFAFFNDRLDESELNVEPTGFDRTAYAASLSRHQNEVNRAKKALASADADQQTKISKRLDNLLKKRPQLKAVASVFQARKRPRTTHLHLKGNFLEHGKQVSAGVPAVLPPLRPRPETAPDRLDLAHWLVDPQNPLTARVEINRIWSQLFGIGLVRTPEDFGTQGEPPTHPSLLDWLASEFQQQQWSRKQMIRLIVTSATYRQSSTRRSDMEELDPDNRLLARQNRFRLDAELIRDQYLLAGGLLNNQIGGPSFTPPLPSGISQLGFRVTWKPDKEPQQHRRGIYIVTRRNLAFPMLTTFDRPDANVTCVRRERSTTPLQSLTQMNDPLMMKSARALAVKTIRHGLVKLNQQIELAVRTCLSRRPTSVEISSLSALYHQLHSIYHSKPDAVRELVGNRPPDEHSVELATWIMMARTILNLDEFITRE